jgi:hypothetical protein
MKTEKWRAWLGEKPPIYMTSIDLIPPGPSGANLLGFAHDALDEIDRLNALLKRVEAWQKAGEKIIPFGTGHSLFFSLGAWWADRPWRNHP